jgi:hypothetical protein
MNNKITREMTEAEAQAFDYLKTSKALNEEIAKRRSQGDRFVQVNTKILAKQSMDFKNVKEYQLMNFFYDRMGKSNALMISNKKMAALLDCSTRTVITIIKMLEVKQYIRVIKIGTANAYVVNADVAWKTGRDGKTGAVFNATVVADWDEQLKEHVDKWTARLQPVPTEFMKQITKSDEMEKLDFVKKKINEHGFKTKTINQDKCPDTNDMFDVDNFIKND